MEKIYILCVDDEPDVLRAVARDLAPLEEAFPVETASSADEAKKLIGEILDKGDRAGLILCDHVMPGQSGVDLMIELRERPEMDDARMVLFTGQAGHEDTIEAINRAGITRYIAKPWDREVLLGIARNELSSFIIASGRDPLPYMRYLDRERLADYVHRRNRTDTGQ